MSAFTISVSEGRRAFDHNRRIKGYPKNAKKELQGNNKTIKTFDGNFKDRFNEFFQGCNVGVKSKHLDDYFNYIEHESKNGERPCYEYVVQIGNKNTNGTLDKSPDAMKARKALDNAMAKLEERYPAFHFWFIGSHGDEPNGTYHYHICFTPVGKDYKKGMKSRVSVRQALKQMGFKGQGGYLDNAWKQDLEHLVQDEMASLGLEREFKDDKSRHLSVPDYKYEQMVADLERERAEFEKEKEDWYKSIGEQLKNDFRAKTADNLIADRLLEPKKPVPARKLPRKLKEVSQRGNEFDEITTKTRQTTREATTRTAGI